MLEESADVDSDGQEQSSSGNVGGRTYLRVSGGSCPWDDGIFATLPGSKSGEGVFDWPRPGQGKGRHLHGLLPDINQ